MNRLTIALLVLFFAGCASHSPILLSLDEGNPDKIVGKAQGYSKVTNILGIGALNENTLAQKAKSNLIQTRPLKNGEKYVNIAVDVKRSYFILFNKVECFVTADIVREGVLASDIASTLDKEFFEFGDVVLTQRGKEVEVNSVEGKLVTVKKQRKNGKTLTKRISVNNLFKPSGKHKGVAVGQKVDTGIMDTPMAKVVGIGVKYFLIRYESGRYGKLDYKDFGQ